MAMPGSASKAPPTPAGGGGFLAPTPAPQKRRGSLGGVSSMRMKAIRQSTGGMGPIANVPLYQPGETPQKVPEVTDRFDCGNALTSEQHANNSNRQPYRRESFSARPVKGEIKSTPLGANLNYREVVTKARVTSGETKVIEEYRWMNTPLEKRALAIDQRVEDMEDRLEKHALAVARRREGEAELAISPVGRPCVSTVIVIGRVCCETTGKLNERSVMLEGSLRTSHGQRVMYDFVLFR